MLKVKFEKIGNFEFKIVPNIYVELDADLLSDLQRLVEQTLNAERSMIKNSYIIVEIDMHFFDNSEIEEIYEKIYKQQITRDLGAYAMYYDSLQKFMINRKYDTAYLDGCSTVFEEQLEEMSLNELLNLSEEKLQEIINEYLHSQILQ